ncbi:unnamed protein product [Cochlearia groenlandica]
MISHMKLFSIFVVLIQIQIALSQSIKTPSGPNLVQQLCKTNRYQSLCISTLNLDPRSKTSNLQGLAWIAVDATSKKVNETQQHLIAVFRTISDRAAYERYGTCIDTDYGAAINDYLPAVWADLKAKKYTQAISDMKSIVSAADDCEAQFPRGTSPETGRNKATHDLADMTSDIIKTFV